MDNISSRLYKAIKSTYEDEIKSNQVLNGLLKKMSTESANYKDAMNFANELGLCLEKAFSKNVSSDILPDGKMPFNIAKEIIEPILKENYEIIANQCVNVQSLLNKSANIGLQGVKPSYSESKTNGIINYVSEKEYSKIEKSFLDSLSTNSRSIVDTSVRENADFHYQSGLKPKIVRKTSGKSCKWCQSLAGTYNYADVKNTGNDVFRRHANCNCIVSYDPGDGSKKVQDVWSKTWNDQSQLNVVQKRLERLQPKKYLGVDVTKEYYGTTMPKQGKITYDTNYNMNDHRNEIEIANLVYETFGGNITLLNEVDMRNIKTADYSWNDKLWDLKTVSTEKSADSAIRKGIKQIIENPGGIILDYRQRNIDFNMLMRVVDTRMTKSGKKSTDIMIVLSNKEIKIYRYKK